MSYHVVIPLGNRNVYDGQMDIEDVYLKFFDGELQSNYLSVSLKELKENHSKGQTVTYEMQYGTIIVKTATR